MSATSGPARQRQEGMSFACGSLLPLQACQLVSQCLEQPFADVASQTFKNTVQFFTFPGSRFEQGH